VQRARTMSTLAFNDNDNDNDDNDDPVNLLSKKRQCRPMAGLSKDVSGDNSTML
jgi:hypothetical protein